MYCRRIGYHPESAEKMSLLSIYRRARENGGMLTKLKTEKMLLRKEMFSRATSGRIIYTPKGDYVPVGYDKLTARAEK